MLTSGYAPEANCILNDASSYSYSLKIPGDADLNHLIPGYTTFDATKLEFDVVAEIDGHLTFSYVFASEEYNEFVHTSFNDVFGFYINGKNVAMVGGIPVSIDNVNPWSNPTLYTSNDGRDFGYPTPFATQYDGFTRLLVTSPYAVSKGQTYHIKLAVADAGDSIYDSTVYIRAQSLAVCPMELVFCRGVCAKCCEVGPPSGADPTTPPHPNQMAPEPDSPRCAKRRRCAAARGERAVTAAGGRRTRARRRAARAATTRTRAAWPTTAGRARRPRRARRAGALASRYAPPIATLFPCSASS